MPYFSSAEAASRYSRFRPKVHAVVQEWLAAALGDSRRFKNALDIACGTGDSAQPLLAIADLVDGVDQSAAMLVHARQNGIRTTQGGYDSLPPNQYELLSVCMAFHWFDRSRALQSFRDASTDSAVWVVYHFSFEGHANDDNFNRWFRDWYLPMFPAPPRRDSTFRVTADDQGLTELAHGKGMLTVRMPRHNLAGYFTTQSNVEASLGDELTVNAVEQLIFSSMPVAQTDFYNYAYSYTIASFARLPPVALISQ